MTTHAYAGFSADTPLKPHTITRRKPVDTDVVIDILYCGVCHSDLHQVRDEWGGTVYPCVPGHEIVGRVVEVGSKVSQFKPGDLAGVGCLVDGCLSCPSCKAGLEQHCVQGPILTYNSPDKHSGGVTYGGYSQRIVVDEHFTLRISDKLDLPAIAPLLCAGITTYSPLKRFGVGQGKKAGIVGLGGLGHMGVKFAHAFGAHTVVFSTSPEKKEDAFKLGADEVIISKNEDEMQKHAGSFDFILDTVSAKHDLNAYLNMLKVEGTLVLVGAPTDPLPVAAFGLIGGRKQLAGSLIGGLPETQEMLDYCAMHSITSDIEIIPIQQINEAYERMLKGDVKYRFVIDMASINQ